MIHVDGAPGWNKLCEPIVKEIEEYNKEYPDSTIEVLQVKEKFGGLRFYVSTCPQYIKDLIREAEKESFYICQYCGKSGTTCTIHRWIYTVCPECKKKIEDEFISYYKS